MIIGIDLGSNQLTAAWVGGSGSPQLVPDRYDSEIFQTPVSLGFENSRAFVGRAAEVVAEDNPVAPFARQLKLALGSPEPVLLDARRRAWFAETALTPVLQKVMDDAALAGGTRPKFAVLTVPQVFTSAPRQALVRAADWAGLGGAVLINRDLAAARYLASSLDLASPKRALVVSVGTHFVEISLFEARARGLKVLGSAGARLGGAQMDEALGHALLPGLGEVAEDPAGRRTLGAAMTRLRQRLTKPGTREVETVVFVRGQPRVINLLSLQYQQIVAPVVAKIIELADSALHQAGANWSQVEVVWPVGGCAQEATVLDALAAKLGRAVQPRQSLQASAFGAALHAVDLLAGEPWSGLPRLPGHRGAALALRLVDAENKVRLDELISGQAPWPAQAVKRFNTSRADQVRMVFDLVFADERGIESAALVAFGPIAKPQLNLAIELHVAVNAQGLLSVEAVDTSTGNKLSRTLLTRGASSEPLVNQRTLLDGFRYS